MTKQNEMPNEIYCQGSLCHNNQVGYYSDKREADYDVRYIRADRVSDLEWNLSHTYLNVS